MKILVKLYVPIHIMEILNLIHVNNVVKHVKIANNKQVNVYLVMMVLIYIIIYVKKAVLKNIMKIKIITNVQNVIIHV